MKQKTIPIFRIKLNILIYFVTIQLASKNFEAINIIMNKHRIVSITSCEIKGYKVWLKLPTGLVHGRVLVYSGRQSVLTSIISKSAMIPNILCINLIWCIPV